MFDDILGQDEEKQETPDMEECKACQGLGHDLIYEPCPVCHGDGKVPSVYDPFSCFFLNIMDMKNLNIGRTASGMDDESESDAGKIKRLSERTKTILCSGKDSRRQNYSKIIYIMFRRPCRSFHGRFYPKECCAMEEK